MELARLTGAGISISKAAKVLQHDGRAAMVDPALKGLEQGLADGQSIAGSLESSLNPMEWAVVQAAEQSGKLADGFAYLSQYYTMRQSTVTRIRGALVYPVFMLHAAVVLPAIVGSVMRGGSRGDIASSVLLGLGVVWGVLLGAGFGFRAWTRLARTSVAADEALKWLPVVGAAREALALARWHTVMHFQIMGGQRISAGLERAGAASWQAGIQAASHRAAAAVEAGETLADALAGQGAFPRPVVGALASAEFTGTLDLETLRLSRESMAAAAIKSERAAKLVCAGFYGLVMLFTVWQIFQVVAMQAGMYLKFMDDL